MRPTVLLMLLCAIFLSTVAPSSACAWQVDSLLGDANGDGVVNLFDLVIVSLSYDPHTTAVDPRADLDSNGSVDLFDLVRVASQYGAGSANSSD